MFLCQFADHITVDLLGTNYNLLVLIFKEELRLFKTSNFAKLKKKKKKKQCGTLVILIQSNIG